MGSCDRCGSGDGFFMSFFNTETICIDCQDKERKHPKFIEAQRAEEYQLSKGDYNFVGIGKPEDL